MQALPVKALVAQWIEQWLPKPKVGGSNPFRCAFISLIFILAEYLYQPYFLLILLFFYKLLVCMPGLKLKRKSIIGRYCAACRMVRYKPHASVRRRAASAAELILRHIPECVIIRPDSTFKAYAELEAA